MQQLNNYNFAGKKVQVRVDFNVPLNSNFEITDDNRMQASLPTIKKLIDEGAGVILMSHLGRPKGGPEDKYSLRYLVSHLSKITGVPVKFAPDCIGKEVEKMKSELKAGEILLLENLRFYDAETTKNDSEGDAFAQMLAAGADAYVNDAFGSAHREHASTARIAKFFPNDKMFGYLMNDEVESINKVLHKTERPFTAIMGGAKVSDKILVIENLLDKVDNLIIGGGMVYTFIKAQGGNIGKSLCEEDKLDLALAIIRKAAEKNVKLLLPVDNVIADDFKNEANTEIAKINEGRDGWMGLDIAEETIKLFCETIENSKTILWNGPMGVFEMEKFQKGTKAIAEAIARATKKGAFSLVGGGDSVAAVNQFGIKDDVSYVSTGGGALLEAFEGKVLPGIAAILK